MQQLLALRGCCARAFHRRERLAIERDAVALARPAAHSLLVSVLGYKMDLIFVLHAQATVNVIQYKSLKNG